MELGILTAQLAYINQRMGEEEAAMKAYAQLFSFKAELDPAVAAIAGNNMVALRGTRDLFDSWKKCRANIASEAQLKKLTKRQRCATVLTVLAAALPPSPCRSLLASPGRLSAHCWLARLASDALAQGLGSLSHAGGAPQPLRPQRQLSWCGHHQRVPKLPMAPPLFHHLGWPSTSTLRCSPFI